GGSLGWFRRFLALASRNSFGLHGGLAGLLSSFGLLTCGRLHLFGFGRFHGLLSLSGGRGLCVTGRLGSFRHFLLVYRGSGGLGAGSWLGCLQRLLGFCGGGRLGLPGRLSDLLGGFGLLACGRLRLFGLGRFRRLLRLSGDRCCFLFFVFRLKIP